MNTLHITYLMVWWDYNCIIYCPSRKCDCTAAFTHCSSRRPWSTASWSAFDLRGCSQLSQNVTQCSSLLILQSINKFISRHSTETRATVRLCRIKEKCLKRVNGWSSSTHAVQWKRVPKSRSSNRKTTSSSACPSCAVEL